MNKDLKKDNRMSGDPVIIEVVGLVFMSLAMVLYSIVALDQYAGFIMLVSLGLTVFYGSFGYAKPHGNALKYAILAYSLCIVMMNISVSTNTEKTAYGLVAVFSAYIAGRLNKIKVNRILGLAVAYFSVVPALYQGIINPRPEIILSFVPLTNWLALYLAYLVRFKQHKEAGLEESK